MSPVILVVHPHTDCGGWRWAVQVGSSGMELEHCANAGWFPRKREALLAGHESYDAVITALQHVSVSIETEVRILDQDPKDQYGDETTQLSPIAVPALVVDVRIRPVRGIDSTGEVESTCGYAWEVWMTSGDVTRCVKVGWAEVHEIAVLASDKAGATVAKALRLVGITAQYQGN